MEELRLNWLGNPLVELKGRPVKLETRKAAALLAYLSLAPGKCPREILASMFWQEGNQQKALANLRRTLSSLNTSLPGWIEADRATIMLKRNGKFRVDVEGFHQLLSQIKESGQQENEACEDCISLLGKAVEIYRGDFLEGLNLTDSPSFDEWQFFQRDGLRQEFAAVLQCISAEYVERGKWDQAILYARRWLALDRLHEPAWRVLIDLYARSDQRTAALHQYEELTHLLKEQLGQEPEPETRRLVDQIRGREEAKKVNGLTDRPTSFPLLKTKLYIPIPPASRVVRTTLIDRLGEVEKKALTVLSAPAGFGKTTLLAEWIAHSPLPIAWLSLDHGDNDPYRFLAYLIYTLESIHDDIGNEAHKLLIATQPVPVHIILASLINDLEAAGGHYVLVLDDYQFITAHPVHELMTYLLDHMPVNMHLVIATRADPPLGLARLRSKGKFLEIRTNDLRFQPNETVEFLNHIMELHLSPDDLLLLDKKIEGWIAGLQMAALSIQGREDASHFIRTFSGSNRYILDYLTDEVLSNQTRDIRTFLIQTSILDRMRSSLCTSVVEWEEPGANLDTTKTAGEAPGPGHDCQAILEYLEQTNLFIVPLDDEKCWYHYHHLFADLLRAQLLRSLSAQGVAQLHVRAADWFAHNGSYLEAIQHASMASDDERVERFVKQNYLELMSRGEQSWLRSWTGNLSKDLVYSRPWLCIYEAYSHSWFGELDEADRLLEEAEKRIPSEISAPEADSIQGLLAYVKSRVTAMRGDIHRAIELCLVARKYVPAGNQAMQLDTLITLGYEYFLNGDYANASQVLNETIRSGISAGAVINTVAASCVMARLYAVQGLLNRSTEMYQKAAHAIPEESGQHLGARALVDVGIADVLCERNDLVAAQAHMQQGLALLHFWGKADDLVLAHITLARIHLAQANKSDANEAVEKAFQVIQTSGVFSEARHAVEIAEVKVWLAQGDLQAANRWAASWDKRSGSDDLFGFENELTAITRARIYIAQNKPKDALGMLLHLEETARSAGRMGRVIEILLLQALAMQELSDFEHAMLTLTICLTLAEPEGYVRIFLDEGKSMLSLLTRGKEQRIWNTSSLEEYVSVLLEAFKGEKIHS